MMDPTAFRRSLFVSAIVNLAVGSGLNSSTDAKGPEFRLQPRPVPPALTLSATALRSSSAAMPTS